MRVALSGKMGSGKSAVAAHLARLLGAERISFAQEVRAVIADLYGPGHEKNRELLTGVGMGLRRVDPDTWVNVVRRTVGSAAAGETAWVLGRPAFPQRASALRSDGWVLVRLCASDQVRAARLARKYGDDGSARGHVPYMCHASETALDGTPDSAFDAVVQQNRVRTRVQWGRDNCCYIGPTPEAIAEAIVEAVRGLSARRR